MEENDEQKKSVVDEGIDLAKKEVKRKIKGGIWEFIKPAIPYIMTGICLFFAALLMVGLTMVVQKVIFDTLTSILSAFNGDDANSLLQTDKEGLLYISKTEGEEGAYKLVDKDLSKKIREELEKQKVNNEVMGFEQETLEETIDGIDDMLDKYIKAEIQTTYPKTEQQNSDLDGVITIKRASSETGETDQKLKYKYYDDFVAMVNSEDAGIRMDALNWYSINPETFELCIARKKNITNYENFDGTTNSESRGKDIEIDAIDYKKRIQNYSTPLNFCLALHLIAQDVDFMNDFIEMVLGDETTEPIVLTYVDSYSCTETEYIYFRFRHNKTRSWTRWRYFFYNR